MKLREYDLKKLKKAASGYFSACAEDGRPLTVSGLAHSLGVKRAELLGAAEGDAAYPMVSQALGKIECYTEEKLYEGKAASGLMFILRSSFGWKDSYEPPKAAAPDLSGLSLDELRKLGGLYD